METRSCHICWFERLINSHRSSVLKMPARAKEQGLKRAKYVRFICKRPQKRLSSDDHQTRIHSTNRLLPVGSLKRGALRGLFAGWVKRLYGQGRLLTSTLAKEVWSSLRQEMELQLPPPHDEILCFHALLKQARKRQLENRSVSKSAMDTVDTLPYEAGSSLS